MSIWNPPNAQPAAQRAMLAAPMIPESNRPSTVRATGVPLNLRASTKPQNNPDAPLPKTVNSGAMPSFDVAKESTAGARKTAKTAQLVCHHLTTFGTPAGSGGGTEHRGHAASVDDKGVRHFGQTGSGLFIRDTKGTAPGSFASF